jgi:hypothetical protein
MPVAILATMVVVGAFFAWASWATRRNRWRTSRGTFQQKAIAFLEGTLTIDEWEAFLAHPMGDPQLERLRQQWDRSFVWEAGQGRDEVRAGLEELRGSAS